MPGLDNVIDKSYYSEYYSALYINSKCDHATPLAHRSTKIGSIFSIFSSELLKTNILEILNNNIGVQQMAAYAATKEAV